jgi:hypothetical protein
VTAAIDELGFVGEILASRRSGRILDGHLRVAEALRAGQALVPVGWLDCASDEEEAAILATYDPLGALATADRERLAGLTDKADLASERLRAVLATLATRARPQPKAPPDRRVKGAAFGPQGGGRRLGRVGGLIYPVVVECPDEASAECLLEQLAEDGHRAYLISASASALEARP